MFYKTRIKDHIRLPPDMFGEDVKQSITQMIKKQYEGFISPELGFVIDVAEVNNIGEGTVIPGDGAAYYQTDFNLITFKPEMQEVVLAKVKDIAEFGVFLDLGCAEAMVHISQTMDDFVSFSKEKVLTGKNSKNVLKVNDKVRARIIAVSYKDIQTPKIGCTMRQEGLGKLEWLEKKQQKKQEKKKGEK